MSKVYTTQELLRILQEEKKACLNGKRLNLKATPGVGNPVIDKFLKPDAIQKFTAYQDFQAAVHEYQRENQVSGIVWRQIQVAEITLDYPMIGEQLIALPEDLEILKQAKDRLIDFWHRVTANMDLYLSLNGGKNYRQIKGYDVDAIAQRTEWACIWKWEKSHFLEMLLQLGWGQPGEASDRRGWPASGSEYIHAVRSGKLPIC